MIRKLILKNKSIVQWVARFFEFNRKLTEYWIVFHVKKDKDSFVFKMSSFIGSQREFNVFISRFERIIYATNIQTLVADIISSNG